MKRGQSSGAGPDAIVAALRSALVPANRARALLAEAGGDPFRSHDILAEGLAAWDEALTLYTAADRAEWSEAETVAVEAEFGRSSALVHDLLAAQRDLPLILEGQRVAIRDDEIFLQHAPEEAHEDSCCFTRIRFRNRTGRRVEIRVTGRGGAEQESQVFAPGEADSIKRLDGKGRIVPGGLGRCVTIEARAHYPFGWGEYHSTRLCCDDEPLPQVGSELPLTRPVNERHSTRLAGIELLELLALSPCPETLEGSGTGSTGTASSGITGIPGLQVERQRWHFGAHVRIGFVPNGCKRFCFVQAVKRLASAKMPGAADFRVMPGMSTPGTTAPGDRWKLDVRKGDRTPCYPHTRPIDGGGLEMRDYPGVENPFGRFELDGKLVRLDAGTELKVVWTFRTWVVCLDPPPPHLLGQFDWAVELTLTIGRNRNDTTGRVDMTPPRWSDTSDVDEYRSVAGQAQEPAGFLP